MPVNPNGSCLLCRVNNTIKKVNDSMKKYTMVYAFFYLLLFELGSIVIRSMTTKENYDTFWFPLLTQLMMTIIFYNLLLFKNRLKFCQRKTILVKVLTIYYFLNFVTILVPICNTFYINIVTSILLLVSYVIILLTLFKNKQK
jgi:hypothetical protein